VNLWGTYSNDSCVYADTWHRPQDSVHGGWANQWTQSQLDEVARRYVLCLKFQNNWVEFGLKNCLFYSPCKGQSYIWKQILPTWIPNGNLMKFECTYSIFRLRLPSLCLSLLVASDSWEVMSPHFKLDSVTWNFISNSSDLGGQRIHAEFVFCIPLLWKEYIQREPCVYCWGKLQQLPGKVSVILGLI
jgi:hypothetical protein